MFLTKVLIEFYNHKAILPSEIFEFRYGYSHTDQMKQINKFIDLIKLTEIHEYMDSFVYITMLLKWLFVFNNPVGQVKTFKQIKKLIDMVVNYCIG